jgi:hypothetical protein
MGINAIFMLETGLKWLQKIACLIGNCPFEPFLGRRIQEQIARK